MKGRVHAHVGYVRYGHVNPCDLVDLPDRVLKWTRDIGVHIGRIHHMDEALVRDEKGELTMVWFVWHVSLWRYDPKDSPPFAMAEWTGGDCNPGMRCRGPHEYLCFFHSVEEVKKPWCPWRKE